MKAFYIIRKRFQQYIWQINIKDYIFRKADTTPNNAQDGIIGSVTYDTPVTKRLKGCHFDPIDMVYWMRYFLLYKQILDMVYFYNIFK